MHSDAPATRILPADAHGMAEAVRALAGGAVVGLPTETVYGLAADATQAQAVDRVYAAKGRPHFNPLIIHVADRAMAEAHVLFSDAARALAERFWPGPLTLILPRKAGSSVAAAVSGGQSTLAVRCPAHPVMQHVIRALGKPIATPSANASGQNFSDDGRTCAQNIAGPHCADLGWRRVRGGHGIHHHRL